MIVDKLLTHLVSANSLATQTALLVAKLCPTLSDATECVENLTEFWADIGNVTYPLFLNDDTCTLPEVCKPDITCEEYMSEISKIETHDITVDDVVEHLQVGIY